MASSSADGSEDVNDFLQRIKELGDRRDQEDEERNRKLEEEILQGRKERQARRAERARSISPTKSSPGNTPIATRQSTVEASGLSQTLSPTISPQAGSELGRDKSIDDAMERLTGTSTSPTKENVSPGVEGERVISIKASPSSVMPSRNSPLSWQRRPNSELSDRPRSRPLSMVAVENAARSPRATPEPQSTPTAEPVLSRDQIAQSLASKDPTWFRQSAESRGGSSPAFRKNQVEDEDRSDHGSSSSRVQLPGMSREGPKSPAPEGTNSRTSSPSRGSFGLGNASKSSGIGSPVPLTSAQRFEPPNIESMTESRALAMSPSQGRISPERLERPASPTKGMGGFVQSAMMKRSDSVNKRWSVQSPPGLTRGNSIASSRSSHDLGSVSNASVAGPRTSTPSRDGSPKPPSRPTSSHSNATVTQDGRPGTSSSMRSSITSSTNNDGFIKPGLPASRSHTPQEAKFERSKTPEPVLPTENETALPISPSKTMDPRRWSPTKSSWLESALNKPDSPKPKPTPPPQQPSWMTEIAKAKQKGSVDLGRSPTLAPKHEVNIGGLMRSPPPGGLNKPIGIGGLPSGFSASSITKSRSESVSSQVNKLSPGKEEPTELRTPTRITPSTGFKSSYTATKIKPDTPPKKDFRANLKPRQPPLETNKEEPEFKNVFGQLRRTKTENYVAPDELKNNITRGKAALNLTGGPKKTERKDEFKDAILKKKEDFKKAQLEGKGVTRSISGSSQDTSLPEALAKRKVLGRSDSNTDNQATPSPASSTEPAAREISSPNAPFKENTTPSRLQGKEPIGGKLAGRLNPALASILARGPPSIASETSRSSSPVSSQRTVSMSTSTTNADSAESGPQLTHMTKARARGPRRKAPSSTPTTTPKTESPPESKPSTPKPEASPRSPKPIVPIKSPKSTEFAQKSPSEIKTFAPVPASVPEPDPEPFAKSPKPIVPIKSPKSKESFQKSTSDLTTSISVAETLAKSPKPIVPIKSPKSTEPAQKSPSRADSENQDPQPASPKKLDMKRRSQFLQELPNSNSKEEPIASPRPLSPIKPLSPTKRVSTFEMSETPVKTVKIAESVLDTPQSVKAKAKPDTPPKSPSLSFKSNDKPIVVEQVDSPETAKLRPSPLSPKKLVNTTVPPGPESSSSPTKSPVASQNHTLPSSTAEVESPVSVKNAAAQWSRSSATPALKSPRSPIKLPTHADEKAAMVGAGLRPASPVKNGGPIGLGLQSAGLTSSRALPTPPSKNAFSPPPSAGLKGPTSPVKPNDSPIPQTSEASRLVANFFGKHGPAPEFVADTATIISTQQDDASSIKTLRATLYQLSPDGKKQPVPNFQERLLFEENMYLCVHTFGNKLGKKVSEVYFWSGDEVPSSAVSGAVIFAEREAKSAGARLIMIRQGKEPPAMFQALGGIIIVRRGSSNKYDSLAPHILCGRKIFGQIAFDEVDYSPSSLCSGFPYLIATQSGKSYLWKGKGSGIDELSCARLIGMDFGLTGEIEEIEDGSEPASFLDVFGSNMKIQKSADHWKMKPNYNTYCSRLFCADVSSASQMIEISPFSQTDISPSSIYMLDAFFEIYIIVGSMAQSEYAAFHIALIFAQEYGILAAGLEDRPYVPVTTVILEGIPRDLKSVFRKWRDEFSPTITRPASPGLTRGRSLRVVPLTAALEATRRG